MNIDILCNDGSPLGVGSSSVYGDGFRIGVGGAELALLTMCETWHGLGNRVRLYNNPDPRTGSEFEQFNIGEFEPKDDRDVLIIFRSPNPRAINSNGLKVWWSTDQFTRGDYAAFSKLVEKVVCISPFHQTYFEDVYGIKNTVAIDLPVRLQEYKEEIEKVEYRFIYTSVPNRGLQNLWRIWPMILEVIPYASLVITSDYRLWGTTSPGNDKDIADWLTRDNIKFLGGVSRERLVKEQLEAEIHIYPCNYDELFCISVAESQVAGVFPITTAQGALKTTNMGVYVDINANDPRQDKFFVSVVKDVVNDAAFITDRNVLTKKAIERFNPLRIVQEWDKVFNENSSS
ncbi:hypothetical protein AYK26_07665 [Euryarchaeota archaeon SM23-78]|nr:MAG: hypothetical protein AYK26_07665 [Euryarchaeota archaeon SM23-78]